jgi:N-acetylmuramic acid 6-phosphate etherase
MNNENLPVTEQENPRTANLSELPVGEIVRLMNEEDRRVAEAIALVLPAIITVIEAVVERLKRGGRLFYTGTGTSGRLGVLDASECPPTFGVAPDVVQGVIAGGWEACYKAVEASEDDEAAGGADLQTRGVTGADAVIGLAASGRTPYTCGALVWARGQGAFTAAITCVPDSRITQVAEVSIVPVVGPEVVTGSTRLKAGTAQKLVLNMISTAALTRLGYVKGNRMTNLMTRNVKLRARAVRILAAETSLAESAAGEILTRANNDLRLALVMQHTGRSREEAERALTEAKGVVQDAILGIRQNG